LQDLIPDERANPRLISLWLNHHQDQGIELFDVTLPHRLDESAEGLPGGQFCDQLLKASL
jgi:hypothetical protein